MPRRARVKNEYSIYHIMCRSISEALLFRDDNDKDFYLNLLKKYKDKYKCSIYAYCLMSNHLHIQLDPRGFDISCFMQSIDVAYVRYYNKKYNRRGPLFQDRFVSRLVNSNEYNLMLTAYIHNNSKDLKEYYGIEERYPYSSYGIYAGIAEDKLKLIDISFIMGLFNERNMMTFRRRYVEFVRIQSKKGKTEAMKDKAADKAGLNTIEDEDSRCIEKKCDMFEFESSLEYNPNETDSGYSSGRHIVLRNHSADDIMKYLAGKLGLQKNSSAGLKSKQATIEFRALSVYFLRTLCGLGYKDICKNIYNVTASGCSKLCSKGYELVTNNDDFGVYFDELCASVF